MTLTLSLWQLHQLIQINEHFVFNYLTLNPNTAALGAIYTKLNLTLNTELFVLIFIVLTKSIIKGLMFFMRGFELTAVFDFVSLALLFSTFL